MNKPNKIWLYNLLILAVIFYTGHLIMQDMRRAKIDAEFQEILNYTPAPTTIPITLNSDLILDLINNYRVQNTLYPVMRDEKLCELTDYLAESYSTSTFSKENFANVLKNSQTEDYVDFRYAMANDLYTDQQVFDYWINAADKSGLNTKSSESACISISRNKKQITLMMAGKR